MSSKLTLQTTVKLNNGVEIPQLGFGVFQSPADITANSVTLALKHGYRHIDCAQGYRNEAEVGQAVRSQSFADRKDIFVTTKIPPDVAPEDMPASLDASVKKIDLEGYVDLYLIHAPLAGPEKRPKQWANMEALLKAGKTRSIGISNYGVKHMQEMKEYANVPPAVNQLEIHPWCQQPEVVKYCQENNIAVQAYSPLVQGKKADDPTLTAIAKETGKSWAQVLIRWSLQRGFIPLPKSDTEARIISNADVYDFELSDEQMAKLNGLHSSYHICWSHLDIQPMDHP